MQNFIAEGVQCTSIFLVLFQDNGFLFIHTPVLTANDCEGAGEMFHVKVGILSLLSYYGNHFCFKY